MKRFIFLTFAILAWVFFELSGGTDFEPRKERVAEAEAPAPETATDSAGETRRAALADRQQRDTGEDDGNAAQVARLDTSDTQPATVDRAALEAAVQAALGEDTTDPTATEAEVSETDMARVRASLTQGLSLFDDGQTPQTLQLASLSDGAASLTEAAPTPEPAGIPAPAATFEQAPRDIREVIGTRVNMRDGPGTIYPVVARMRIGQQVEVLSESGTGWLRLRTIPDGQPGWIASSLISKPAN